MQANIAEIEGIGPAYAAKLATAGIHTIEELLDRCADANGRKRVAEATGVSAAQLLKWANMADLMRISGIGRQYAELLEAAGVDTVKELRTRNAANLAEKMEEVNTTRKLAGSSPALSVVGDWIEKAKKLEPRITH